MTYLEIKDSEKKYLIILKKNVKKCFFIWERFLNFAPRTVEKTNCIFEKANQYTFY